MQALFWKGPCSLFGRLIRLRTGSAYTHVDLRFSDGDYFRIDANFEAKFLKEPIIGRPTTDWWPTEWDCIYFEGGDEKATKDFCRSIIGAKYDWLGVVCCQLFNWNWEKENKWFCSEACIAALQYGGYKQVFGLAPHRTAPHEMANRLLKNGGTLYLP